MEDFIVGYGYKVVGLLIAVVCYLILWFSLRCLGKMTIKRIISCSTAEKANRIRKKAIVIRNAFLIISLLFTAIVISVLAIVISKSERNSSVISACDIAMIFPIFLTAIVFVGGAVVLSLPLLNELFGNISPKTIEDVIATNEPFSLFLRGFHDDDTSTIETLVKSKYRRKGFSEYYYCKGLGNVFAIGNPKELDAPFGAPRVYLDNSTWKEQVHSLLVKADSIHIRVCDTPSCEWEIAEALSMKEKVFLIVDSIKDYDSIRADIGGLPLIEKGQKDYSTHIITFNQAGQPVVERYRKTTTGYTKITDAHDTGKPRKSFSSSKISIGGIMVVALFALLYIAAAPDLISFTRWMRNVTCAISRADSLRSISNEKWISIINERLPLTPSEGILFEKCYVHSDSICFKYEQTKPYPDGVVGIYPLLMDTLFRHETDAELAFYESALEEYNYIVLSCKDSVMKSASVVISEDDLIALRRMRYHIPSHRSYQESMNYLFEDYPTENDAMY